MDKVKIEDLTTDLYVLGKSIPKGSHICKPAMLEQLCLFLAPSVARVQFRTLVFLSIILEGYFLITSLISREQTITPFLHNFLRRVFMLFYLAMNIFYSQKSN